MASKLNPGADATLVNVAYRAAMANAPKDYSDTLERAADSYEKTMEASSEMWGKVAEIGGKLGSEMVKNANERAAYAAKAETLNPEDAEVLLSEIYGNKDAQRELGLLPGVFGSRETKKELAKLKMEQQELFAEIDLAAASLKAGTDAVASGAFDTNLAMGDGEMVNAIIKSGLKNRVTDNKNIAKLSRDEETGDLIYTLYNVENNPDGEVLMGDDGKPRTMTIRQFNESIATNVDDKGAMAAGFKKYNDQVADRGFKSRTGVYDKQMRAMDSNWLDTQLGDKPVNLKRAMHMKFGYMETSFYDDITKNKNEYSAALYADLLKATGGGDVLTGVITDGMKDTDGVEGISAQEAMNSENYKVLTANLLGMKDPEVTKALFKDYTLKEFEKANNYGHGNKAPKPGSGGTDTETDGFVSLGGGAGKQNYVGSNTTQGYVPNSALNFIGKSANDRADIDLGKDKYIWDEKNGVYTLDGTPINNKSELFTVIYGENFDPSKIIGMYNSIKDWQGETRQDQTFDKKTGFDISFIDKADQVVASELNDKIPPKADTRNPRNLSFKARGGGASLGFQVVGLYDEEGLLTYPDFYPDGVIINGEDMSGKPHPAAGKEAIFGTRAKTTARNTKNLQEMIDILKTFGLYDNTKPVL